MFRCHRSLKALKCRCFRDGRDSVNKKLSSFTACTTSCMFRLLRKFQLGFLGQILWPKVWWMVWWQPRKYLARGHHDAAKKTFAGKMVAFPGVWCGQIILRVKSYWQFFSGQGCWQTILLRLLSQILIRNWNEKHMKSWHVFEWTVFVCTCILRFLLPSHISWKHQSRSWRRKGADFAKPAVGLKQTPSKVASVLHGLPAEIWASLNKCT